jgi:uncharacterized protein
VLDRFGYANLRIPFVQEVPVKRESLVMIVLLAGANAMALGQCTHGHMSQAPNNLYPANRVPLAPSAYIPLPLGAVKPAGWLRDQLVIQAEGITGHIDDFWPSLQQNAWKGDEGGEGWERGPYYLDGLVPLAYLLDDPKLLAKVKTWMEPILASGQPNGWFGPHQNHDRWPLAVALKVVSQYHEATGDHRALEIIQGYFRLLASRPPDWPDQAWRGARAMEHVVSAYWLYNRTGDPSVLEVAKSIYLNSLDWSSLFLNFPYNNKVLQEGMPYRDPSHYHRTHVVNLAMAIKYPGIWFQQSHNYHDAKAVYEGLKSLDRYHGQATGRFSGDEHLSGTRPTQGTELCAVVEFMFSLERLIAAIGDPAFADRLELLAYNANPGAHTADYWAHQYDQQANQVLCSVAKRDWSTNSDTSNIYGVEPHYGCCTANMHQGWPKFVSSMWMATPDRGLAAVALGPNTVKAKVAQGTEVIVEQQTSYPFDGSITFKVKAPAAVKFPLHVRIPGWAIGAEYTVKPASGNAGASEPVSVAHGKFAAISREWHDGDVVELVLPMDVRIEQRFNKAVSVLRGPIYFSLKIGEQYTAIKRHHQDLPAVDWQIDPTTPWNYALQIAKGDPGRSFEIRSRPVGQVPFEQSAAPVVLGAKARQVPGWQMKNNSADDPPVSPVESGEPLTDVELIPYGSARLRITEFPVLRQ